MATADKGKALITKANESSIHFTLGHRKAPERFVMIRTGGKNWLLLNTTPQKAIPYKKVRMATIPAEKAEKVLSSLQPGSSVQAKVDGAASLTHLVNNTLEVASYRAAKNTGAPIMHTERVLGNIPKMKLGKDLNDTILRGELYGVRDKKGPLDTPGGVIPPQELGGLLNATLANSMTAQQQKGVKLKNLLFDIQRLGGKPMDKVPYNQRMEALRRIAPLLPQDHFSVADEAKTPQEALQLFKNIRNKKHPLTQEGVVVHPPTGKPAKVKFTGEHDVHVSGLFPGQGKYRGASGGFTYSLEPGGPTVGKVGTGFTDETRRRVMGGDWIGRIARIKAQQQLPSGAYRAPSFIGLHEDYPLAKGVILEGNAPNDSGTDSHQLGSATGPSAARPPVG